MSEKIIELTESNFDNNINDGLVLVDFWAEWCAPCLALAPTIEELAIKNPELKVVKVNVDSEPKISNKLNIRGLPTVILFKDGEQVDMVVGNNPQGIRSMVEQAL